MTAQVDSGKQGGCHAPEEPKVGWSHRAAKPGDTVFLGAKLVGYLEGAEVTFTVFPASGDPADPIAVLKAETNAAGLAVAQWTVLFDVRRHQDPRLVFQAKTNDSDALSPICLVVDTVDVSMQTEDGTALGGVSIGIVDNDGNVILSKVPDDGHLTRLVPIGEFSLLLDQHLLEGEEVPGSKRLETGKAHAVVWKKMTHTVEMQSPRDGEVYLVGQRIPIKATVLRAGKDESLVAAYTASGAGEIQGGQGAGQGASREAGEAVLVLSDTEGEVTLTGAYLEAKQTITIKVIKPKVRRFELVDNESNLFPLFHHGDGQAKGPAFVYDDQGRLDKAASHPAAAKFATKLKAKVILGHELTPTRAAKVDIALLARQPFEDEGLLPPSDEKKKNKPLIFRVPEDKRSEGVSVGGGDWAAEAIELIADRELPACVKRNVLEFDVHMRLNGEGGWSGEDAAPEAWGKIGEMAGGAEVFGIWEKPEVAGGTPKKPDTAPLRKNELDRFHLFHATRWAEGAFNLKREGDRSILVKVLNQIAHYSHPDGYESKDGKPAAEHQAPQNASVLGGGGISTGEVPPTEAPCPDDKLEVEVERRGGRALRNPATDISLPVLTSGALQVEVTLDAKHDFSVRFYILVDGQQVKQTDYVSPGGGTGLLDLGPVKPGGHTVTISPEVEASKKQLTSWKGKATVHFSKPESGRKIGTEDNWGFSVLDNPTTPGGKGHQAASAVAAALNVLGVKAVLNLIEARENGAINFISHDPVTVGAPCFDPEKHWGDRFVAFPVVQKDDRRDQDPVLKGGAPLGEDGTVVLDLRTKKVATLDDAKKTGHARRMPNRDKLVQPQCRCGHPIPPEKGVDWVARIQSGAPFFFISNDSAVCTGAGLDASTTYKVQFLPPDGFRTTARLSKPLKLEAKFVGQYELRRLGRTYARDVTQPLTVDQGTGAITLSATLVNGTHKGDVKLELVDPVEGTREPFEVDPVGTVDGTALKLDSRCSDAGWTVDGSRLVAPPGFVDEVNQVAVTANDAQVVPDKHRINVRGAALCFDNTGRVTDENGQEIGRLAGAGVEPFEVGPATKHETEAWTVMPEFERRFYHDLSHIAEAFTKQVSTDDGTLKVLVAPTKLPTCYEVHFRVLVDGVLKGQSAHDAPQLIDCQTEKGQHEVKVEALVTGHGPGAGGVEAAVTIERTEQGDKKGLACQVCGAQPTWAYKIDGKLQEALIQSIVYRCAGCGSTVHEEDADCWACGESLQQRDVTAGWTE